MWQMTFSIQPVAKARARVTSRGAFTPRATAEFERSIRLLARMRAPKTPIACPLRIAIVFWLPKPKRTKHHCPAVRPDLDNYLKAVMDALNGIVWVDDGQICEITAGKYYCESGKSGSIFIQVSELEKGTPNVLQPSQSK